MLGHTLLTFFLSSLHRFMDAKGLGGDGLSCLAVVLVYELWDEGRVAPGTFGVFFWLAW